MRQCDVLVIGGGPAGATAALLLARGGRSVVVLEKAGFPRGKVCGEVIAGSALRLLREMRLDEAADGPEVRSLAVWTGRSAFGSPMPRRDERFPRALRRESLDALLLASAARSGAEVLQPASAWSLDREPDGFLCHAGERRGAAALAIRARTVIGAHGSWEPGLLPTQPPHLRPSPQDLLGFKARFRNVDLPAHTIVLVPFTGGYAGLVESGEGEVTFAACIRRGALEAARMPGAPAGDSMLRLALEHSRELARAMKSAEREGTWLAAGPLRPGRRPLQHAGVFAIGNAAREVHPVVGQGVAMAMQSGALLARALLSHSYDPSAGKAYAHAARGFALRSWLSARFAHLAMRPAAAARAGTLLRRAPALLTFAARCTT